MARGSVPPWDLRSDGAALLAVLALAAFTHLYAIEYALFKGDQANFIPLASELAQGRSFPTAGTAASVGWLHPPLAVYLFGLAFAVARDPLGLTVFVALTNIGAVGILYGAARSTWGRPVAVLAAGLLALAPGSIHFGRFIWNSNLIPPVAALALWGLLAHGRGRRWGMPLAVFSLLWAVQLHPFSLLEAPVVAVAWWAGGWRTSWRALALGMVAGTIPLSPYVYRFLQEQPALPAGRGMSVDTQALEGAASLLNPAAYFDYLGTSSLAGMDLSAALSLFALGGVWLALWWINLRAAGPEAGPSSINGWLIAALWGLLPPVLSTVHVFTPYVNYQVGQLPALCLLAALLVDRWLGKSGGWVRWAVVPVVFGVAGLYGFGFLAYAEAVRLNEVGRFHGPGLVYTRQAAATLAARMEEDPVAAEWTYVASRSGMGRAVEAFLGDRAVVRVWGDQTIVLPPPGQRALYLVPEDVARAAPLLKPLFGDALAAVIGPPQKPAYSLYSLPPDAAARLDALPWRGLEHRVGDALVYDAFLLPDRAAADAELILAIGWRVTGSGARWPPDLSTFAALVDRRARAWGDDAHELYAPRQWRAGERGVDWYQVRVDPRTPPGRYWVEVAIFRDESQERLTVSDGKGRPVGTAMRLGPLRIVARPGAPRAPERAVGARWHDGIILEGFDPPVTTPGNKLVVRLYWRASQAPLESHSVFVHLVDQSGRLVAQDDGLPRDGDLPTNFWLSGEQIVDEREVALTSDLAPGQYRLLVGWYQPETGRRLPLEETSSSRGDDALDMAGVALP